MDEHQLIVGQAVTQDTNDKRQLMPMITIIEHTGARGISCYKFTLASMGDVKSHATTSSLRVSQVDNDPLNLGLVSFAKRVVCNAVSPTL